MVGLLTGRGSKEAEPDGASDGESISYQEKLSAEAEEKPKAAKGAKAPKRKY